MADLLALCPVLYKDYAPPLVSMNGGMHMVLSVGEPLLCKAHKTVFCFPHSLCFTGHTPFHGAALCAPAASHVLSCSSQKVCMGDHIMKGTIGLVFPCLLVIKLSCTSLCRNTTCWLPSFLTSLHNVQLLQGKIVHTLLYWHSLYTAAGVGTLV